MKNVIAISGKSGCGNTTISGIIAANLGYKLVNYTFRQMADKYNVEFKEMLAIANKEQKYDLELDKHQIELALLGNCVLGSRLAIWLLKDQAITVYINAGLNKRISNIQKRENNNLDTLLEFHSTRDEEDHQRFKKLYGIDNNDFAFSDIIIEADNKSIDEIVMEILEGINTIRKMEKHPTTTST